MTDQRWKAWRVVTPEVDWEDGVVWGESRGKAMWHCVRRFCDAFNCTPRKALDYIILRRVRSLDLEGELPEPRLQTYSNAERLAGRWS